jgi:dolichyl-diphosphooligosaccharide--protein glycosyltransferase/undecaprenyl-diphosphooligosaccharide--protein glycosyltransferase
MKMKNKNSLEVDKTQLLLLILTAYLFSIAVRLIWLNWAAENPLFYWNGEIMINTNDGYFFASGAAKELFGLHQYNPRVPNLWDYGTVFFTYLLAKITPFSLETIILYMPAIISSLVVIPIILIARLYKETLWGFFSALLASIIWSYYNRTMIGYYDSDMFSAMAPMFILYFLIKSTIDFDLKSALFAAFAIAIYPFLYDQGRAIVFAMGIIYAVYMVFYHKSEKLTYQSLILIFVALTPFHLPSPYEYLIHFIILIGIYFFFKKDIKIGEKELDLKKLMIISGVLFLAFLIFGDVIGLIWRKISSYIIEGTTKKEGLNFFAVNQTVREASKVLFFPVAENLPYKTNIAHRMMGSSIGLILALLGYLALVWRHKAFILALPLIGIGVFAHWGGLRFTVYAVPIAGMSAIYLFWIASEFVENKLAKLGILGIATALLLIPNIKHIQSYLVPTVLNKYEVKDLDKLNKIASAKDYTIAWWDYGYPIWFYSETSTLIDGGKHNEDNFLVSTIMQTDSQTLAANLARLSVETYVKSGYKKVTQELFENQKLDPNELLANLRDKNFKLPKKTRDVFLYLPYRMFEIFPTVMLFGNLDLTTGKELGLRRFIITIPVGSSKDGKILKLSDGTKVNLDDGTLEVGNRKIPMKRFVIASLKKDLSIKKVIQNYHSNGIYTLVYLKSYGRVVIMNEDVFNSTYVQMFLLGNYDKDLFELVVKSPYTRIYKLKI